jgi:hypothetical protein
MDTPERRYKGGEKEVQRQGDFTNIDTLHAFKYLLCYSLVLFKTFSIILKIMWIRLTLSFLAPKIQNLITFQL